MGMLERRRVGGRAHGETPFQRLGRRIERQKKNKHEIHHGLRQPSINYGSHNNQPKTGSRVGGKYGGEVRQAGRVGVAQYHHSGGVVSWITGINYNKPVEFSNYFFLGRFVLFSKTQPHRPRSTSSPEATGVGRLEMQKAMPLDRRPTPLWWCSLLDGSTLVNHLFVLFLCNKCYGMLDKREFCFVLLCVVNVNCSIKRSSWILIVA
jgi:hypothetical protein